MTDEAEAKKEEQQPGPGESAGAKEVDLAEIEPQTPRREGCQGIDFLLDIPLEITVELGRTRLQVGELLRLGQGSVVEMEKLVNDPVDLYVNQKLVAQGEVVVINEKFGVRLTNIINPGERLKKLG